MAQGNKGKATKQSTPNASLKPGSNVEDARKVGGDGDFGAPAGGERTADRDYVSRNTKMSDPGAAQPFDFEQDGVRDHGAGARASGPGSGSGGDIDPDIVGLGTGGSGVSFSGNVGRPPGPDDSDGSSDEFAAGGPAQGRNQDDVGKIGGSKQVRGDVLMRGQDQHTNEGEGADDVTNASARGDDSFAGEVSSAEARGEDNSPSEGTDDLG